MGYLRGKKLSKKAKRRRPMVLIDKDGSIYYRTILLRSLGRAAAFASLLSANPRFTAIEIIKSRTGYGFYVQYQPSSDAAKSKVRDSLQASRYARALVECGGWIVEELPDLPYGPNAYKRYRVETHLTDGIGPNEYQTVPGESGGCTCPDYLTRCRRAGILCKHQIGTAVVIAEDRIRKPSYLKGPFLE